MHFSYILSTYSEWSRWSPAVRRWWKYTCCPWWRPVSHWEWQKPSSPWRWRECPPTSGRSWSPWTAPSSRSSRKRWRGTSGLKNNKSQWQSITFERVKKNPIHFIPSWYSSDLFLNTDRNTDLDKHETFFNFLKLSLGTSTFFFNLAPYYWGDTFLQKCCLDAFKIYNFEIFQSFGIKCVGLIRNSASGSGFIQRNWRLIYSERKLCNLTLIENVLVVSAWIVHKKPVHRSGIENLLVLLKSRKELIEKIKISRTIHERNKYDCDVSWPCFLSCNSDTFLARDRRCSWTFSATK